MPFSFQESSAICSKMMEEIKATKARTLATVNSTGRFHSFGYLQHRLYDMILHYVVLNISIIRHIVHLVNI